MANKIAAHLPNLEFSALKTALPKMLWVFIIGALLFVLIKFLKHRILVKRLEMVKGGYVVKSGRYSKEYDKTTRLYYLKPMFGDKKLPIFPDNCFQKVDGMPFIGIRRQINLIYINQNSPKVSLPTEDTGDIGTIEKVNVKRWYFFSQKMDFVKKFDKGGLAYFLQIFAPTIVILSSIIFFGFLVAYQVDITQLTGQKVAALTEAIKPQIDKCMNFIDTINKTG